MTSATQTPRSITTSQVDVSLPLHRGPAVDIDLTPPAAPSASASASAEQSEPVFQPSLSQVAADPSRSRVRWPGHSRSGYHGSTNWNWIRDGQAGFGERSIG